MKSKRKTDSSACCSKLRGPSCLIYSAHFLSAWGDRMWHFSVALYLVYLDNKSLRLAAIYGFSSCGAVLLFGSLIGDWVDRNPRLKVVRTYLFIQNCAVILSAVCILLKLQYEIEINDMLYGHMPQLMQALVILLAIIAQLASVGCKIAIEKDWIVVVAGSNRDHLANLNASTRAIDQLCKILSPLVVGQVMTFGSLKIAAGSIAGWNLVSMFVEYYILYRVYIAVPELAHKKTDVDVEDDVEDDEDCIEMENVLPIDKDRPTCSTKDELDQTNVSITQSSHNQNDNIGKENTELNQNGNIGNENTEVQSKKKKVPTATLR